MTLEDYVDLTPLNQGGFGRTYQARHQNGEAVCIKEFRFGTRRGENDSFKALEMFQREAEILKSLKHPQIPEFKDYFVNTSESGEETYYLVMELIEGKNLLQLLEDQRFDVESATQIAEQVLYVLEYLHHFPQPLIHRDIKPSNIILKPSGDVVLIDFGSVQTEITKTIGGSTIVGTGGYAPFELFLGEAYPATDLYALGATLMHLLTRKEPRELIKNSRIQTDGFNFPQGFKRLLDLLLEPNLEGRMKDAKTARMLLFQTQRNLETALVPVQGNALVQIEEQTSPLPPSNEQIEKGLDYWTFSDPTLNKVMKIIQKSANIIDHYFKENLSASLIFGQLKITGPSNLVFSSYEEARKVFNYGIRTLYYPFSSSDARVKGYFKLCSDGRDEVLKIVFNTIQLDQDSYIPFANFIVHFEI